MSQDPSPSSLRFETAPYQPDGGFGGPGLLLALAVELVGVAILTWPASYAYTWLEAAGWAVMVGLAAALGGVAWGAIGWGHVRHGGLAFLLGLTTGGVAWAAVQYWVYDHQIEDWRQQLWELAPVRTVLGLPVRPNHPSDL